MLEKEMELLNLEEMANAIGGIKRDANNNIIYTETGTTTRVHEGNTITFATGYIQTDDGTHITVYRNINGGAGYDTNCHGQVYADGKYWIDDTYVNDILFGDGYTQRSTTSTGSYQVGDIVTYYNSTGVGVPPVHSAKISSIGPNGIMVQGLSGDETQLGTTTIENGYPSAVGYAVIHK